MRGMVAAAAVALVSSGLLVAPAMAALSCSGYNCIDNGLNATKLQDGGQTNLAETVQTIINVILWVVGVISVGFIIYGGVKYAMSSGDSSKVKAAKDTLMYAVIGLIVSLLAYAIVNFVIGSFGKG